MQRGYKLAGAWSTATRGGWWVAKDDCLCGVQDEKDHASSGGTKFKPQIVQSIIGATSTGKNGGT